MYILGISAYHGDCSACLIKDGQLVSAVEEERFRRIKHWAGFPSQSIDFCLGSAKISLRDIDYIAVGRNTHAHLLRKLVFILTNPQSLKKLRNRLKNKKHIESIPFTLASLFDIRGDEVEPRLRYIEHHKAHMASAYLVSGFERSAVFSVDGFGDFVSCMLGVGEGNNIKILKAVFYPHSLGLFYTAITQLLGFTKYGDEYKVMGLASWGRPIYKDKLKDVIRYTGNGSFKLNLSYFLHYSEGVDMTWNDGEPIMGNVFSKKFTDEFGPQHVYNEPHTEHHYNLAASLQSHTEDILFALLNDLYDITKCKSLCLAGGVAMNSVVNGKIFKNTPFTEIYIQPAAGDAGTSLGAAYYLYNCILKNERNFVMHNAYWGPEFKEDRIEADVEERSEELGSGNYRVEKIEDENLLCQKVAQYIANGKIVGWFQGKMEWGPRALGNRSILCDPRNSNMKDILNARIKKRESFRPFAPSILEEKVGEYFEVDYPAPFMTKVYPIKKEKRALIPAVTHIDGSGRLQTVAKKNNPLYWSLIKEFENITGIPVVLNTSFNENEPIVCKPKEAIECFIRTKMDILVLKNLVIT